MKKIGMAVACFLALSVNSYANAQKLYAEDLFEDLTKKIIAENPKIPGVIMAINSPSLGLAWSGAAGVVQHGHFETLRTTDAFRIASVTKIYTAATVLRLMEDGKLGLYEPIQNLLPDQISLILAKAGYDLQLITPYHLLTHTSGIPNFAETDEYFDQVFSNLSRVWTPDEQIQYGMTYAKQIGKPGEKYEYSDTGYVILGQLIEHVSGKPLHEAVAEKLDFAKWGLSATYFEKLQPAPVNERRIHHYKDEQDITDADPSMDLFGGGGIISTVDDLVAFIRLLATGKIFVKDTTLTAALIAPLPVTSEDPPPLIYRGKVGARTCLEHGGFWGVELIYCPDIDLAIAFNVGQVESKRDPIVNEIAKIIEAIEAGTLQVKH